MSTKAQTNCGNILLEEGRSHDWSALTLGDRQAFLTNDGLAISGALNPEPHR